MQRILFSLVMLALAGGLAGCKGDDPPPANTDVFKPADKFASTSTYEYKIDPPDQIMVRAPQVKELDPAPRTVGPDGKITFNLIGSVFVTGLTPDQLAAKLKQLVSKYYTDPDVKVEVIAQSKFVQVFGQGVTGQGKYGYTGRNTVISTLADANLDADGWPEKVILNRPSKGARVIVDFTQVYVMGDMRQNFLLEEGDILYVQLDPLSKFNRNLNKVFGPLTGASNAAGSASTVRSAAVGK